MCQRADDDHESIGVQWIGSFVVEICQRAEDFHRSSLKSSGARGFDRGRVRELMMSMSPLESSGAGYFDKRYVRELMMSMRPLESNGTGILL